MLSRIRKGISEWQISRLGAGLSQLERDRLANTFDFFSSIEPDAPTFGSNEEERLYYVNAGLRFDPDVRRLEKAFAEWKRERDTGPLNFTAK